MGVLSYGVTNQRFVVNPGSSSNSFKSADRGADSVRIVPGAVTFKTLQDMAKVA